jgi:PAS domain S-box-containing protein
MQRQPGEHVYFTEADLAIVREAESRISDGLDQDKISFSLRHRNGDRVIVEAVVKGIRNADGLVTHWLFGLRNVTQQAEAEQALRKSEEQYRMLAENIVDMVVLITPEHERIYISPSSMRLIGYAPAELMGSLRSQNVFYSAEDEAVVRAAEQSLNELKQQATAQYNLRHRNGNKITVEAIIKAIRDGNNNVTHYLLTVRNVMRQIMAEQALRKSEEHYRLLADNMTDMILLLDQNTKLQYVSPSCLQLTGYTPGEIELLTVNALIHPDDLAGFIQTWRENIGIKNDFFYYEFRGVHKTGAHLYISAAFTVIKTADGSLQNVLVTCRNIDAAKRAQIALKENEEKYRSLVQASEDIILIMDEKGTYLFANEIACQRVNSSAAEVIGKTIYDFFDEATGNKYVTEVRQVLATGQKITFEAAVVLTGKDLWLRNTLIPIYDSVNHVYAVMLCVVDITDIKNYAETLLNQNRELKQIAHLQSHVVRAPLANIEGLVNLLDETDSIEQTREYLQLLKIAAAELDGLVKEVVYKSIELKNRYHLSLS